MSIVRATPFGTLFAIFGFGLIAFAAFCWHSYGNTAAIDDIETRLEFQDFLKFAGWTALAVGAFLVAFGAKLAFRSDMSHPHDPEKPVMRF